MIQNWDPISQAFVASLFTWSVTALGAAVVFLIPPYSKKLLDVSLGFAAGVMTAASFWSLLAPAIELAEVGMGPLAFFPVAVGFALGAGFVFAADRIMPNCILSDVTIVDLIADDVTITDRKSELMLKEVKGESDAMITLEDENDTARYSTHHEMRRNIRRRPTNKRSKSMSNEEPVRGSDTINYVTPSATVTLTETSNRATEKEKALVAAISWRRILLLIIAVTVHNIPEGLAVGVAFGSIGKAEKATFGSAFTLALGIGLQNFPEGLAVSLPLAGFGHSKFKSFFYGQLSGMVEPIAALAGAAAVILMEPVLPYALSFAAGAMIYVVVDDIIPEAQRNGNGKLASIGAVIGFLVMMCLDVGLG